MLTKGDVIKKLKELGINLHWDTVLNWERDGLLPKSKMVGRKKEFPRDYVAEVYACYKLKRGRYKLTNPVIKEARQTALMAQKWLKERDHIAGSDASGDQIQRDKDV